MVEGILCVLGTQENLTVWHCHHVMHCFNSMWQTESLVANFIKSADLFLGVPFNIASYALLTMMVAKICQLQPYEFVHTFGDLHLYSNHLDQAEKQLSRDPRPGPIMKIHGDQTSITDFKYEDFELLDYDPHPLESRLRSPYDFSPSV